MQQVGITAKYKYSWNNIFVIFSGTVNGATQLSDALLPERVDGATSVLLRSLAR